MSKRIVVTGAAGFIGRNLVAELNRRGMSNLVLVDALGTDDKWENLVGLEYEDLIQPGDFLDALDRGGIPAISAIIHLGACSATTERNADFLLENNYRYTRRLCAWALANAARFVYASSAATYGDGSNGYDDDPARLGSLRPLNMYGYSKHMFDLWARSRGLFDRIVGLKYFNVYGPHEAHKGDMRSVVHKSYQQVRDRGYIELFRSDRKDYADGEQKRDFIFVNDAVDATIDFAMRPAAGGGGGLFNCGTGEARTWVDLATAVFSAMGRKPDIRFIDMPPALRGKYQYFTQATTQRLRAAGYTKPFTALEAGVKDYVTQLMEGKTP